ncbi:hypothetical protein B7719_04390 [Streptococcus oralis subsp. oralis]|uniref:hypothetical protein n=1 Tax=Streptococcus oralis TaxID=1303 RepID=UPI000A0FA930|nr:hypothetical protein [Streptococcus oralis]ORO55454.1 hypothetical protein B7719_04390 [Streptococcus oralis subsp. oralis]
MKKALVLNFSFIAIILSACFISFVVILLVTFHNTHNTFSGPSKSEIESVTRSTLKLYGFEGDVKVTKYSRYRWPSVEYEIEYDYSEEVNGRKVTVSDSLIFDPKSSSTSKKTYEALAYDGTIETMLHQFSHIADQLLNQDPVSVSNKEKVESFFKQYENPNLEFVNSYWSVDTESDNIQDYYALIEKNHKEGKAFQGLYDLPIDEFLGKGIIKGSVRYKDTVLEEGEKDYFDVEGGLTGFISNGIDNAELPDAFYEVSYYYGAKGYRSGSGVSLKIKNHKLISYEKNRTKKF